MRLLASGKSTQDPKIESAINFLKNADIVGPYAIGMRCQVWTFLPRTPETMRLFRKDADQLLKMLNTSGVGAGMWDYDDLSPKGPRIDHSVTQYCVLGLWACAQAGIPIDAELWSRFDNVWRQHQAGNGGWSYDGNGGDGKPVTLSMTAAGIATLYITMEFVPPAASINCTGQIADENIEKGFEILQPQFQECRPKQLPLVRRRAHRRGQRPTIFQRSGLVRDRR